MKINLACIITNNHRNVRSETPDLKAGGSQDLIADLRLTKKWSDEFPATGAFVKNLDWLDVEATVAEELKYRETRIKNLIAQGGECAELGYTLAKIYDGCQLTTENAVILSGGNVRCKFVCPLAIAATGGLDGWDLEIPVTERGYSSEEKFIAACLHGNEATFSRVLPLTLHDRATGISRMPSVLTLDRADFLRTVGMGGSGAGSQSVLAAWSMGALARKAGLDLTKLGLAGDSGVDPGAVNQTAKNPDSAISVALGTFPGVLTSFLKRVKPEDRDEHIKLFAEKFEKDGTMYYTDDMIRQWWAGRTRAALKLAKENGNGPAKDELKQSVAGVLAANQNALATELLRAVENKDVDKVKAIAADSATYAEVDNMHRKLSREHGGAYNAFLKALDAGLTAGLPITDFTDFAVTALEVHLKPAPVEPAPTRRRTVKAN